MVLFISYLLTYTKLTGEFNYCICFIRRSDRRDRERRNLIIIKYMYINAPP